MNKHWCISEAEAGEVLRFIKELDPESKPEVHYIKYPKIATQSIDKDSALTLIYIMWDWVNPTYPEYLSIL